MKPYDQLRLPRYICRNELFLKILVKSGESMPTALGRLVLFLDEVTRQKPRLYRHVDINRMVAWKRSDIFYSEVLEIGGFGVIEEQYFRPIIPKGYGDYRLDIKGGMVAGKKRRPRQHPVTGKFLKTNADGEVTD